MAFALRNNFIPFPSFFYLAFLINLLKSFYDKISLLYGMYFTNISLVLCFELICVNFPHSEILIFIRSNLSLFYNSGFYFMLKRVFPNSYLSFICFLKISFHMKFTMFFPSTFT
jgi:hypothetical protein